MAKRWLGAFGALAVLVGGLTAVATTPAAADSTLTLNKTAPASVLLGDDIPYELTAANAGPDPLYNVGFSDVLPPGFEYKAPTSPASAGEPTITTNGSGQQVLAWTNVTDLQANSDFTLSFTAKRVTPLPDTIVPVDTNSATVAGQSNERTVPKFDANGAPINATSQASDTATTTRDPFVIEKEEPSLEGELLRGVHDQRTVYTLRVRNNKVVATEDITITDYIPAGLEFLGCGNVDNSQVVTEEYPNSGPLGVPAIDPIPCPTPDSVETVENPGSLTGVYTAVTWTVGTLAPDEDYEIKYVAGIPLQENTMTWEGQTPPTTGEQGSNLDNNTTGASTREGLIERSLTNHVEGTGYFTGSPEQQVTVTDTESVQIEDIRMRKRANKSTFVPGDIVTFNFEIDASEYMDGSGIVLTDRLPDGFCPLSLTDSYSGQAGCAAGTAGPTVSTDGGTAGPLDYASVTWNAAEKRYDIDLDPVTVSNNKRTTVTLPARMLTTYRATGAPTVAGDSFENTATLIGDTTPVPDVVPIESGTQQVTDASQDGLTSAQPSLDKQMKPRPANPGVQGMDCDPAVGDAYGQSADFTDAQSTFRKGDILCFKLRVDFPSISTKDAIVGDFVPTGTEYVAGSATATGNNTTPFTFDDSGPLKWTLGTGGFVDPDETFEVVFAARVLQPAGDDAPELTGNLMKMRTVNTAGEAQSFRDEENFSLAPPPNLTIKKGVAATSNPAATFNPPADGKVVRQGSTATFQVDIKNDGFPDDPDIEYSVRGVQTWDVLPPGIACTAVDNFRYIPTSGGAAQPLPGGIAQCVTPPVNGQSASAYIKWTFPTPDNTAVYAIAPDETLSVLYDMDIPDPTSVSARFDNTAYVRSMDAFTDVTDVVATYYPENNIDTTVPEADWDAPEAKDPSWVITQDVTVTKVASTSVNETGNNLTGQATIGETIQYTYTAKIPAGTTVYRGVLRDDVIPSGVALISIDSADLDGGALPGGFTFDTDLATNPKGELVFPQTYENDTTTDQLVNVKVTAKVQPSAVTCAAAPCLVPPAPGTGVPKSNTARFTSYPAVDTGTAITKSGSKNVSIVQPNPSVTKAASPTQLQSAGEEVTYTVVIGNAAGWSKLHNPELIDCLPAPLDITGITAPAGTTATEVGSPTCANTGIRLTVDDSKIDADETFTLEYTAKLVGSVPSAQDYENTATLTGTSMPGTVAGERTYTTSDTATITSPRLAPDKDTTPDKATIGQTFTSVLSGTLYADVDYYSLGIIDTLPTGVDPTSAQEVSVTCSYPDDSPCAPPVGGSALTPSGQKIGWSFGDVPSDARDRLLTITYTAVVADLPGNIAGATLTNSATPYWSSTAVDPQPTTIAGFEALPNKTVPVSDTVGIIEPSLSIVKKVDAEDAITATPGQEFTYTLKVSNASGENVSTANSITVTDDIPAGIEVVGSPSDGGQVSGSTITWSITSLAPGADKTLSFTARLKAPASGDQTNTATVTEYFSLPDEQGRKYGPISDTARVTPVLPSLTIAKDASAPLAYISEPYTWTIVVTNASGTTAYGVDVADTLPPNWSYKADSAQWVVTGGTPAGKEPTGTAPNIAWNDIADLPTGKTLTLTFQAIPGQGVVDDPGVGIGTRHTNSALTTWTLGPAGQGWGTGTSEPDDAYTQIASADLALTKTHDNLNPGIDPDEVVPGTEFEWILKATNNGPDTSVGPFTITDTLPTGVEYRGHDAGDWSCNAVGQVVTCTNPAATLAKDASLEDLVLTVWVDPATTGLLENTAEVGGSTYDPDPENNTATDEVTARPLADVSIVKTRTQPYVVGGQVTYTLTVTNLGPSVSVKDITVVDTLPAGLSIAAIDAGAWDCSPTSGETDTLTCVLETDLAPNEQAPLINVTVDVLESPGDTAVNSATVTPTTEDPNPGNNTSTVEDPVVADVQLGISKKTTGANPVTAGRSTEFTITVTNAGPAKAKNVQVVDQLEAGLRATSATGPGWTCDVGAGSVVTCTRANFPVSASPSDIVITADVDKSVPGGTTLKNTATVTTTSPQEVQPEPATSTVDVVAKADLAITKTHTGGPWKIGRQGTWNVLVANNGPSDNPGPIRVTDTLPKGNAFVSATGDGWACTASGQTVVCELPAGLLVGQSAQFSIRVDVVSGAFPQVVNPAEVTSPIEDTDPSNNRATDSVPVERARQTAEKLPPDPSVLPATKTNQGQKIRTKVRCRPLQSSAAGEASYCKVRKAKSGTIRVKVFGNRPVLVIVTQFAKGTRDYEPFKRVKKYRVRP